MTLKHFENVDIRRLLFYYTTKGRLADRKITVGRMFLAYLRLMKSMLSCSYKFVSYKRMEGSRILLMTFEEENMRKDIVQMLYQVAQTIPSGKYDKIGWQRVCDVSFKRFFIRMYLDLIWMIQMKRTFLSKLERVEVVCLLNTLYDIKQSLQYNVNVDKYRLALVYYDAPVHLNYLIQYMKGMGCKTATLQHGVMLAKREKACDNLDFCGIEFGSFVSDYFLAWNDFTKNEAIKSGINKSQILVLGCAKCLGYPQLHSHGYKTIGVILDGKNEEENNLPMIKIVERFVSTHDFKYILRFHPADDITAYDNIRTKSKSSVCGRKTSLYDFLTSVTFCVVANSTVLFELEYYHVPFVRYSSGNIKDKYKDYPGPSFNGYDGFCHLISSLQFLGKNKDEGRVFDKYSHFFAQIEG